MNKGMQRIVGDGQGWSIMDKGAQGSSRVKVGSKYGLSLLKQASSMSQTCFKLDSRVFQAFTTSESSHKWCGGCYYGREILMFCSRQAEILQKLNLSFNFFAL